MRLERGKSKRGSVFRPIPFRTARFNAYSASMIALSVGLGRIAFEVFSKSGR
jgi:hypothetical protein